MPKKRSETQVEPARAVAVSAPSPSLPERPSEWLRISDLLRGDWPDLFRWPGMRLPALFEDVLRVEEEITDGTLVIRAEMPGIDPDKDVAITVSDGQLHLKAERRRETKEEAAGRFRTEFRYGSYSRTLPLPKGVSEKDVTASYKDGILEVRVPCGVAERTQVKVARG
jgi:HSP20 family protein